ncbi:hypothetical protein KC319_g6306 [Hortaea werneckii]|nr:hypothetical protein KC317_g6618 [Hortaea werneckii]KAI7615748.1 hypothetical protein KC346_g6320 [Hortaea werneckii]KAI7668740.1 hypothetical protein KC319_g6306 [Hortaea werneckii]KAI7705141.1 hypothetical protein KC322_g6386 [Hortaea werneckii]
MSKEKEASTPNGERNAIPQTHQQTSILTHHPLPSQERAKASQSQSKGKLGRQLDQQRGQSQTGLLAQNARDNVAARDADAAAEARNYN